MSRAEGGQEQGWRMRRTEGGARQEREEDKGRCVAGEGAGQEQIRRRVGAGREQKQMQDRSRVGGGQAQRRSKRAAGALISSALN